MKHIKVAEDFSDAPGGRASGEEFRKKVLDPALKEGELVKIDLDGTFGYPIAFLKAAFEDVGVDRQRIILISQEEPSLRDRIHNIMEAQFPPEHVALECDCFSTEHVLHFRFNHDEKEIYTEVMLRQYRGFFKRLWVAIKYLFGYKCRYGHFDCFSMSRQSAYVLRTALEVYLETKKK